MRQTRRGLITLLAVGPIDGGAILGAEIITLSHALSRIMGFPKCSEQLLIGDNCGIVDKPEQPRYALFCRYTHLHNLGFSLSLPHSPPPC